MVLFYQNIILTNVTLSSLLRLLKKSISYALVVSFFL